MICRNCGTHVDSSDGRFCPNCGWGKVSDGETSATEVSCPVCWTTNPASNLHCEACAARLGVRATATPQTSVRPRLHPFIYIAAAAVVVIVLLAMIFNGVRGDTSSPTVEGAVTEESDLPPPALTPGDDPAPLPTLPAAPVTPVAIEASSTSSDGATPAMLIDGDTETVWHDASLHGEGASLTFQFDRQIAFETMTVSNLTDGVRFARNFRVRGFSVEIAGASAPISGELEDTQAPQTIDLGGGVGDSVTIRVTSTYAAESVDGQAPFEELAISEISFTGR